MVSATEKRSNKPAVTTQRNQKQDVSELTRYLSLLGYEDSDTVYLRAFLSNDQKKAVAKDDLRRHGKKLSYLVESPDFTELQRLNDKQQMGLYLVVNGGGHTDDEVSQVRAVFIEYDDRSKDEQLVTIQRLGLPTPTFIVESRRSLHFYWVFTKPVDVETGNHLQRDLTAWSGADPANKNLSRTMRVPGFYHWKTFDDEPFLVRLREVSGVRYESDELRRIVPVTTRKMSVSGGARTSAVVRDASKFGRFATDTVVKLSSTDKHRLLEQAYRTISEAEEGTRNTTLNATTFGLGRWVAKGVLTEDEVLEQVYQACHACWSDPNEAETEFNATAPRALEDGIREVLEAGECGPGDFKEYKSNKALRTSQQYDITEAKLTDRNIPLMVVNQRYLDDLNLPHNRKVWMVKSPKGTGKTTVLKGLIEQHDGKVLVVGHRRSLLRDQASKLGLDYYQDMKNDNQLNHSQGLAITLDSLTRLTMKHWDNVLLIFDEVAQVFSHLTGDTALREFRHQTVERVEWLLRHSQRAICLDADLSTVEVDHVSAITRTDHVAVLWNQYVAGGRTFVQYKTTNDLSMRLLEAVKQGKRVFVTCNTKKLVQRLRRAIQNACPNASVLSITSDNSSSQAVIELMQDVNQAIAAYDVVITSPSFGTGVDVTVSHFDEVYAFVSRCESQSATDIMQHIHRVRNPKDTTVHYAVQAGYQDVPVTEAEVRGLVLRKAELREGLVRLRDNGDVVLNLENDARQRYLNLLVSVIARRNASVYDLNESLRRQILKEGYTHTTADMSDKEDEVEQTRQALKAAREQLRQEQVQAITSADDIDYKQALTILEPDRETTEAEQAAAHKAVIRHTYGLETVTEDWVEFHKDGKGRRQVETFVDVLFTPDVVLAERDRKQRDEDERMDTDLSHYLPRTELLRRLIPDPVWNREPLTHQRLVESGYVDVLREHELDIQALLGVKPNHKQPIKTVQDCLRLMGLKMSGKRQRVRGCPTSTSPTSIGMVTRPRGTDYASTRLSDRIRVYVLDERSWERMHGVWLRTRHRRIEEWLKLVSQSE